MIPLIKNWGIFRAVVRAQVVHRVVFTTFFLLGKSYVSENLYDRD